MASKAWMDAINGGGNDWDGAFQYGAAIRGPRSTYETAEAYDQRNQGQQEARDLQNMYLRNRQTMFNSQYGGGGAGSGLGNSGGNPYGGPALDTSNRFEPGLTNYENRITSLLDNPDSISQSAAYKFRLGQGQEALQRQLAAKGMLNSGNRLTAITDYAQGQASQEYGDQFKRLNDLLGNYSQGYVGDKNANTSKFSAQATAWNQAQANRDRTQLGYADIAAQNSRAASGGGGSSRLSGGGGRDLYTSSPNANLANIWDYNTGSYDGENSWYTNALTGAQTGRRGY
jgi:hypothetical protein